MRKLDRANFIHFDFLIILLMIPLVVLSTMLVFELNASVGTKQLIYISVGVVVFMTVNLLPIKRLIWLIPIFYWLDILLLISVKFFGKTILGATRWLEIPGIGLTIQPSELMKPAIILMLAYLIQKTPPPPEGYGWKQFLTIGMYILLPFVLIAAEPDLGSATEILLLGFFVLFVIGVEWKIWAILTVVGVLSSTFVYDHLRDYQKQRIADFLGEKPSYHVQQSIIAIGSGGLTGKTVDEATQAQMKFLPISTTDFIFAYYVERFGFWGAFGLISLYGILILHLLTLTQKFGSNYFGRVMTVSIGSLLFIYMSVNIAMTIGLAPVVGVPLPLFSSGGSSFINFMVLFAILEHLLAFRFEV